MRGWAAASLAGIIAAIFIVTSLAIVLDGAAFAPRIALDVPYSAFTISLWPVFIPLGLMFFAWEKIGRAPSKLSYMLAAALIGMAGLAAFVGLIYEYPFVPPWGAGQWRLALTFAIAGFAFGAVRESHYKRRNN